jgi:FkbM family methyltransferase
MVTWSSVTDLTNAKPMEAMVRIGFMKEFTPMHLPDSSNFNMSTHAKLRVARLLYLTAHNIRRLVDLGDLVRTTRSGIVWELDLREGIDLSIFLLGGFEKSIVNACIRELYGIHAPVVMDIGANIGAYALPFAKAVTPAEGRVYAFEPTRWAFDKLMKNAEANPGLLGALKTHQMFLGSGRSPEPPASVESSWPVTGEGYTHEVHGGAAKSTEGASTDTLDGFVESEGIGNIHLIKLDVDGNEAEVLEGSMACISRFKPVIVMEWCAGLDREDRLRRRIDDIVGMGYRFHVIKRGKRKESDMATLDRNLSDKSSCLIMLLPVERIFRPDTTP